jgi:deoxyribonuclease V
MEWPKCFERLERVQEELAALDPPPWTPSPTGCHPIAGCFVCFPRGQSGYGASGDPAWAGAAVLPDDGNTATNLIRGTAGARYEEGLLALREGPLLERAVRGLSPRPAVLLVNATGRDHPRRAGLAFHLGAILCLPTVGVTHRPLIARGSWPELALGARSPLELDGDCVGYWLCTRRGARPLAVHAAWRTDPETAVDVVLRATRGEARTPEPLRHARHVARTARIAAERS